jgi:hypothetical protein
MRKWFWCGTLAVVIGAIVVYSTTGSTAGVLLDCFGFRLGQAIVHPALTFHRDAQGTGEEETVCGPGEPQVENDCCSAKSQEGDGPVLAEPIDLLQVPYAVPVAIPPTLAMEDDDLYKTLPCCPDEEEQLPTQMYRVGELEVPHYLSGAWLQLFLNSVRDAGSTNDCPGSTEEQEQGRAEEKAASKESSEQVKRALVPQPLDGSHAGQRKVDTLDFRPSDAKPGQFDRIPF